MTPVSRSPDSPHRRFRWLWFGGLAAVILVVVAVVLLGGRTHHTTSLAPPAVRLGAGDNGRTISVIRGSVIAVDLNGTQAWPNEPTSSEPSVVRYSRGTHTSTATQAEFLSVGPGTARLSTSGLPLCAVQPASPGQMCPHLAVEWTVTVKVT
jgi:hypothetical protein